MNMEFLTPDEIQFISAFRRLSPGNQAYVADLFKRYETREITDDELMEIMNKEMVNNKPAQITCCIGFKK